MAGDTTCAIVAVNNTPAPTRRSITIRTTASKVVKRELSRPPKTKKNG